MTAPHFHIAIVGAGIAGASLAANLPTGQRVLLVEGEDVPGFHSTGRSAAIFSGIYGNAPVRALSRASFDFFSSPPDGFCDAPLISDRGVLFLVGGDQSASLEKMLEEPDVRGATRLVDVAEAVAMVPYLKPDSIACGLYEPDAMDLDVSLLHSAFLRQARARGVEYAGSASVSAISRLDGAWTLHTPKGDFTADVLVNAAGAWADQLAGMAGAAPRGIRPMRRTMVLADIAGDAVDHGCPMVVDIDEQFYFRPESGGLLLSPADETPVEPGDVHPEELDIAIAIDRVEAVAALTFRRVRSSWAGLRSFAPDKTPVVGFDGAVPNFFWLAGQGGYGIQTAPALGRLAAALLMGEVLPQRLADHGVDARALDPNRPSLAVEGTAA
ncbi:FAD-dependent oxidoreductase [Rhizorhabdus wittichii DC-6]|nr:FAD-dependent oxidoreductase [Rhizorhabdus wittichii DC-6]